MELSERFAGCLLGLACGDAVGTTLEFKPRGTFAPITDMVGGGPFGLQAGQWTDDTSMALCLAESLVVCGGFDADDQMRRYVRWWQEGVWSSTGRCFDIGNTTAGALRRYMQSGHPFSGSTDPMSAGNGSIMRLAPVPMFYFGDVGQAIHFAGESSRTTHGAAECVDACCFFAAVLWAALSGEEKTAVLQPHTYSPTTPRIQAIAAGAYLSKGEGEIRGSGYVVDSLEAALWVFANTDSYETAVLRAANLGDDADTTAAVVGQVAGAFYGRSGIPPKWLEKITMRKEIETLAHQLMPAHH